jgi:hypothetical protein
MVADILYRSRYLFRVSIAIRIIRKLRCRDVGGLECCLK